MKTNRNIDLLASNDKAVEKVDLCLLGGIPGVPPKKVWLLVVTVAYYSNGQRAYVNISIGGIIVVLLALLTRRLPLAEIGRILFHIAGT